jgi:hypothetical protein
MREPPAVVDFHQDEPDAVLDAMTDLRGRHRGWVNLHPAFDEDRQPSPEGLFRVFSARGPAVPVCTWVAGEHTRGVEHISIGVQHGAGPKAVTTLAEAGHPVPTDWHVFTDHPKRGLVVAVPLATPDADVLAWLLRAGGSLTAVALTGRWHALVYTGS